jgi:hypothetical protein
MLGREVVILINEKQNAGKYNVQFPNNVYQFSSGVYFYKLEVLESESNQVYFSKTRRAVILK